MEKLKNSLLQLIEEVIEEGNESSFYTFIDVDKYTNDEAKQVVDELWELGYRCKFTYNEMADKLVASIYW